MERALRLAAVVMLAAASPAAELDVYAGFAVPRKLMTREGVVREIDVQVGSNQPASATQLYEVVTRLEVTSEGRSVCSAVSRLRSPLNAPIRPLQFRIAYPTAGRSGNATYVLQAHVALEEEAPERLGNNRHQWTFVFEAGGSPSCRQLLPGSS